MEKTITTVTLREQTVSPKKAGLVMRLIRGKSATLGLDILSSTDKKSSKLALSLLKSAIDSAKAKDFKQEELVISQSIVQEGKRMKRFFVRARGRSAKYQKRSSHLKISLSKITKEKESRKSVVSGEKDSGNGKKS